MSTKIKTNAIRILSANKIDFDVITYESEDGKIDGVSVAGKIGKSTMEVFKTLVAKTCENEIIVFVIPVKDEIDLKKAAKLIGVKKIDFVAVKELLNLTGYIRGGCSPIGMKKKYRTFFDSSVDNLNKVTISAGKIGVQVSVVTTQLIKLIEAQKIDLS